MFSGEEVLEDPESWGGTAVTGVELCHKNADFGDCLLLSIPHSQNLGMRPNGESIPKLSKDQRNFHWIWGFSVKTMVKHASASPQMWIPKDPSGSSVRAAGDLHSPCGKSLEPRAGDRGDRSRGDRRRPLNTGEKMVILRRKNGENHDVYMGKLWFSQGKLWWLMMCQGKMVISSRFF